MMNKIISTSALSTINNPFSSPIVLVGGCFDLLHTGHKKFLQQAKNQGGILIVLLESDERIRETKGPNRPHHSQYERAKILAELKYVDYIVLLDEKMDNSSYDNLVSEIKPAIIATTKGDPYRHHKERQAKKINARVVDVIDRISEYSTTQLTNTL